MITMANFYPRRQKRYNMAIVGGGAITEYYQYGIKKSDNINLVALCDLNPNCLARNLYPDARYYMDMEEMLSSEKLDLVLISVGAKEHEEVIRRVLMHRIAVICEKPPCMNSKGLEELYTLADEAGVSLEFLYHFEHGDELWYLVNNIAQYGQIEWVRMELHESYAADDQHHVIPERLSLGDGWYDAASNALSDIWHLMDITDAEKTREIMRQDSKSDMAIYAHKTFRNRYGQEFDILVDWMTRNKTKVTTIRTDKALITINHHDQIIVVGDQVIYDKVPNTHWMNVQYASYFLHYEPDIMNRAKTRAIMSVLDM